MSIKRLTQALWATFLFTFPFSIRFLVYEQSSYRFGQFNPWVSAFVYLPEILLIIIWGIYFFSKIRKQEVGSSKKVIISYFLIPTSFLLNGYLLTLLKGDSMLTAFWLLRVFEVGMIIQLIKAEILPIKKTIQWLLYGVVFQILISFFQWNLNSSMGLKWLGESVFDVSMKGVAKIDLADGSKHIRSYGTFLHPNILAAYLTTIFFLAWEYTSKKQRWIYGLILSLGLLFAYSQAAFLVMAIGLISLAFHKKWRQKLSFIVLGGIFLANIAFFFNPYLIQKPEDLSITERQQQIEISQNMIAGKPFGTGVRNFTLEMENYFEKKLSPWEFQPVHNAYYLILNETGVQGFLLLITLIGLFIYFNGTSAPLVAILILASFDHLLWTSWTGFVLIALVVGIIQYDKKHL